MIDPESGELDDTAVYHRKCLHAGAQINGPAIVIETDTATVITRRFQARVIHGDYMILNRINTSETI